MCIFDQISVNRVKDVHKRTLRRLKYIWISCKQSMVVERGRILPAPLLLDSQPVKTNRSLEQGCLFLYQQI